MKFLSTLAVALAATSGSVYAQTSNDTAAFATGLLQALNASNLTALAGVAAPLAAQLIPLLSTSGNKTILAPNNAAIAALPSGLSQALLINTLAYHVLNGTLDTGAVSNTSHTIAPSYLSNSTYVSIGTNRTQVVPFGKYSENGTVYVAQAANNVSFVQAANGPSFQNIRVQPITQVLSIPGNLTSVATSLGASGVAQLLTQTGLLSALENNKIGLTIFAPDNAAIQAVAAQVAQVQPAQIAAVLANHVINGSVVYSTALKSGLTATSAGGQGLNFTVNTTGAYVASGNVTAKIVRSDVIAKQGVVHVIDRVLLNTASNPGAASSAAAAAQSTAATSRPTAPTTGGNGAPSLVVSKGGLGAAVAAVLGSAVYVLVA